MLKEITFSLHVGPVAGGSKLHAPAQLLLHAAVCLCASLDPKAHTTRTKSMEKQYANGVSVLFWRGTKYACGLCLFKKKKKIPQW